MKRYSINVGKVSKVHAFMSSRDSSGDVSGRIVGPASLET